MSLHTPVGRTILSRTFEPIGRILNQRLRRSIFFLSLHPEEWCAQYYGILAKEDAEAAQRLRKVIQTILDGEPRDFDALQKVFTCLVDQFDRGEWEARELMGAAVSILYRQPVRLAHEVGEGNWRLPVGPLPSGYLTWFQQTLDFADRYKLDQRKFSQAIADQEHWQLSCHCTFGDNQALVVEVPKYLQLPQLVNKDLFEIYVAEYLYALEGQPRLQESPESLSHYLIPLAGLGQWRAAVCWIGEKEDSAFSEITSTLHQALNELCSQALVDVFSSELLSALASDQKLGTRSWLETLARAFAILWWSDDIAFYRQGTCCFHKTRGPGGELEDKAQSEDSAAIYRRGESFLSHCRGEDGRHCVQLDLSRILDDCEELKIFGRDRLGFDAIAFQVRLFEGDGDGSKPTVSGTQWESLEALLKDRISQVFRLAASEGSRGRAEALEAIAHSMKHTIHSTGWEDALERLREIQGLDGEDAATLRRALRSLGMFQVVEAVYGLQNLDMLCERGWHQKLEGWTDGRQLNLWEAGGKEVFELYGDYIRRFVALICSGHKLDHFYFRTDPEAPFEDVSAWEDEFRSVERWIRHFGALPPLTMNRNRANSHLALLATLVEPVVNAARHCRPAQVFVTLEDALPNEIRVIVTNPLQRSLIMKPTGIEQFRRLIERTGLATIEADEREESGQLFYDVTVRMHPQILARRILENVSEPAA